MPRLTGFDQLKLTHIDLPAGTWWMLRDKDTKISPYEEESHRWVLYVGFSARTAFAHGCLRTTTNPQKAEPAIWHARHEPDHEKGCLIDLDAWVIPGTARQIKAEWLDNGRRSCLDPSQAFIAQVAAAAGAPL